MAWAFIKKDYANNIVYIEDVDVGMSVTNDAENVYNYINENYSHDAPTPKCWRVVYKDTQGEWWEMIPYDHAWCGLEIGFERWHGIEWDALKRTTNT